MGTPFEDLERKYQTNWVALRSGGGHHRRLPRGFWQLMTGSGEAVASAHRELKKIDPNPR